MTKPRPHAELATRYMADSTLKYWFRLNSYDDWLYTSEPAWLKYCEYHVGHEPPEVKRTITLTVNGREWVLPEPLRKTPEVGATYWSVDWTGLTWFARWADDRREIRALDQGNLYATKSDAQAWDEFYKWCRRGGE